MDKIKFEGNLTEADYAFLTAIINARYFVKLYVEKFTDIYKYSEELQGLYSIVLETGRGAGRISEDTYVEAVGYFWAEHYLYYFMRDYALENKEIWAVIYSIRYTDAPKNSWKEEFLSARWKYNCLR